MHMKNCAIITSPSIRAKRSDRLSVPRRGRTIYTEAEKRGAIVREATRILWEGADADQDAEGVVRQVFGNGGSALEDPTNGNAALRAAWLLVNEWLYVRANRFGLGEISIDEAEQDFMGDAFAPVITPLSELFAPGSKLEATACLNRLSVDDSFRDLLPYILDPHGPGTRASVMRDPATATARARRRATGVYFTPEDVAEYMFEKACQGFPRKQRHTPRVLDPACGTGVFLRVAFRHLMMELGSAPEAALDNLFGCDICLQSAETCPFVLLDAFSHATGKMPDSPLTMWKAIRRNIAVVDSCTLVLKDTEIESESGTDRANSGVHEGGVVYGSPIPVPSISSKGMSQFHGCVQWASLGRLFPSLVQGADIVIGNPPYSHLGQRDDAQELRRRYACVRSLESLGRAETYLLFVEMMWQLTRPDHASAALVVPMSIGYNSGRQFRFCRKAMEVQDGTWDIAFFDREPHALFGEDVKTRNAILHFTRGFGERKGSHGTTFNVTGLKRWTSRSRADLFSGIRFTEGGSLRLDRYIPKLGSEEELKCFKLLSEQLRHLSDARVQFASRTLSSIASAASPTSVFVAGTAYNFINTFRSLGVLDPATCGTLSGSPVHEITFTTRESARVGMAVLASRLTYWLWQVAGDGFHVTRRFLQSLPIDPDSFPSSVSERLGELGDSLWRECLERRTRNINGGKTTFAFRPVLDSRDLTDVDRILVKQLGLPGGFGETLRTFVHELVVMDDENRLYLLK